MIILWIFTVLAAVMCTVHFLGFVGAVIAKRSLVFGYAVVSWTLLLISVVSGVVLLIRLFHADLSVPINKCTDNIDDKTGTSFGFTNTVCKDGVEVLSGAAKIVVTVSEITQWLIQFCA
jgi:hypothetical protein